MNHTFRAVWPICDSTVPAQQIATEATTDLPELVLKARAQLTGPGHWRVEKSSTVPGSRGVSSHVLIYEAPARPRPPRIYDQETRRHAH